MTKMSDKETPSIDRATFDAAVTSARAAAAAYYDTSILTMTDAEYDTLIDWTTAALEANPGWDDRGVTTQVAAGASAGGDVTHPTPMLSLDKTTERAELSTFIDRFAGAAVNVEVKLDGLAIRAVYENGSLVLAATRGDGVTGENITAQAGNIAGLPAQLATPWSGEVRGEVFMTDDNFTEANTNRVASGKLAFVNPRNATAGTIRAQDRNYVAPMTCGIYDSSDLPDDSHATRLTALTALGFTTTHDLIPDLNLTVNTVTEAITLVDAIETRRSSLGYPIDGAVIKADSEKVRGSFGAGSRTPRWGLAFKYAPDTGVSVLRNIEVAVGRTGRASYRAVIDPVFVGGTTITYASLHNAPWIIAQGLALGAPVSVERRGDVIPRVQAMAGELPAGLIAWSPPATCPQCDQLWDKSSLLWRCLSPECSVVGWCEYALSRDVLDAESAGSVFAEAAVEAGLVNDLADLFDLTVAQVAALNVAGDRQIGTLVATKIVNNIQASKAQPFARQITSWNIRKVGRTLGRRMAAHFGTLDALRSASVTQLENVEGIGTEKAAIIFDGLKSRSAMIDRLVAAGINTGAVAVVDANAAPLALANKTIVVSGAMTGELRALTRTEMTDLIERLGGKASGSVSARTSFLVCAETTSSKYVKAVSLSVPIFTPEEFAALIGYTA